MGAFCCKPEVRCMAWFGRGGGGSRALRLQVIDFDGPVDLWHFYLLRSVGKGAFGKVRVLCPISG